MPPHARRSLRSQYVVTRTTASSGYLPATDRPTCDLPARYLATGSDCGRLFVYDVDAGAACCKLEVARRLRVRLGVRARVSANPEPKPTPYPFPEPIR